MKNTILLTVCFCMTFISFGQVIPLDSYYCPGARWTGVVNRQSFPCSTGLETSTFGIVYKIERDTVVSGRVYHLVSECVKGGYGTHVYCTRGTEPFTTPAYSCNSPAPIFAMIRTDSNRVYITFLELHLYGPAYECVTVGVEYLFYDFNLSVGSSVPANYVSSGITVTDIDSVSLSNGVKVPRYNGTLSYGVVSLVYGVGAQNGFVKYWNMHVCGPGPSASQYLLCYDNPNFNYHFSYPFSSLPGNLENDCFDMSAYLSIPATSAVSAVGLHPNPATSSLSISASEKINSVVISNLMGQTVYQNQYDSQQVHLDVAQLPVGVYFVRINGTEVRRFVKQ